MRNLQRRFDRYYIGQIYVFQNRTMTHKNMACGYSNNSVEAYKSPIVCGPGCERWHHSHLRNDPKYTNQIANNLGREIINSKLPEGLEVRQKKYREPTYAIFSLCRHKWGMFALVESLEQSQLSKPKRM